jgi:hypothetical protein
MGGSLRYQGAGHHLQPQAILFPQFRMDWKTLPYDFAAVSWLLFIRDEGEN